MSAPLHAVSFEPIDPMVDGRSGTRLKSRQRRQNAMRRLTAMPWWTLTGLVIAAAGIQLVATIAEYAILKSNLDHLFPEQPGLIRMILAVGLLVAYTAVWFAVGHRLAVAREAIDESSEDRAGMRVFGPVGVLCVVIGVASMVLMAWRRADVLADQAAKRAVSKIQASGSLLGSETMDSAQLDTLARQAYDEAWAGDFWFVIAVMVLLGAVSMLMGLMLHPLLTAWQVAALRARADRWEDKAAAADTARHAAHDTLRTRIAMREDRAELARRHREALAERFEHAREHARVYLSQRLGSAEATSHVLPSPADLDAIAASRRK